MQKQILQVWNTKEKESFGVTKGHGERRPVVLLGESTSQPRPVGDAPFPSWERPFPR